MSELLGPTERMDLMGELLWLAGVWSSSAVAGRTAYAWGVKFGYGYTVWSFKSYGHQLWLVRSAP